MKLLAADRVHFKGGNLTDKLFIITIIIKGVDGLLGVGAGFLVGYLDADRIDHFIFDITAREFSRDPNDVVVTLLRGAADAFVRGDRHFASVYLMVHGLLKAMVAGLLLTGKHWSYPLGAAFVATFVAYSVHRLFLHFSPLLLVFMAFDIATVYLIVREWGLHIHKEHG
ncbi:MAG: DUF2127 domain-containing protein [Bauldia sp.]